MADSDSDAESVLNEVQNTGKKSKKKVKKTYAICLYALAITDSYAVDSQINLNPNFVAAARWIPVAIDPFISLEEVFMEGIKAQGSSMSQ